MREMVEGERGEGVRESRIKGGRNNGWQTGM